MSAESLPAGNRSAWDVDTTSDEDALGSVSSIDGVVGMARNCHGAAPHVAQAPPLLNHRGRPHKVTVDSVLSRHPGVSWGSDAEQGGNKLGQAATDAAATSSGMVAHSGGLTVAQQHLKDLHRVVDPRSTPRKCEP